MVSVGKVRSELESIVVSGRVVMIRRRLVAVPIWDIQRNKKDFSHIIFVHAPLHS